MSLIPWQSRRCYVSLIFRLPTISYPRDFTGNEGDLETAAILTISPPTDRISASSPIINVQ